VIHAVPLPGTLALLAPALWLLSARRLSASSCRRSRRSERARRYPR
jgi:hypothetical protein